ncbi:MAG TPA: LacI family DNA-binding transcriptional regulator [Solirubrobacteraceae bacterium]|nr:LacI family DNA-binding transcriptional regulator [Solirubrobacteraceae bacterium]
MSAEAPGRRNGRRAGAVTSHDVARAAGVSQSTVSRVLRRESHIAPATRERVLAAVEQLGYIPSDVGRSLSTRSSRTIGIVVTDLTSVFYPYIAAPLHDEVTGSGYRMALFTEGVESDAAPTVEAVRPLLDRLLDRSIDGVVLSTSRLDGVVPRELQRRSLPFVFLTRHVEGIAADSAVVDNSLGASLAAGEAIRLGHERIGAIFGPENTSTGRDRERGVRATLAAAGVELPDALVRRGPFNYEVGHEAMTELLRAPERPSVVLCSNDTVAIGALNAAHGLGVSVPDDVSLVGFDDLPMAAWEVFSLTTVRQPMEEMARTSVRLLLDRIEGIVDPTTVRQRVFEPEMVMRRTLVPPRGRR